MASFGKGISWEAQSTPEMKLQAAREFAKSKPAIVQHVALPALEFKVTCRKLWRSIEELLPLLEEFINGRWKEFGPTRDLAAVEVFGKSWRAVHNKFSSITCALTARDSETSASDKSETLNTLAALPPPDSQITTGGIVKPTPPREDPPEKPAVQAATPQQMKPKNENGKPKHLLAIWRELEESHFGRALNRIDELNRQCPNAKFHVELIAADKRCLAILEQWKQEVIHA